MKTRASLLAIAAWLVVLFAPATAGAHAVLVEATPSDESTTEQPVREVELRFNEGVSAAFGGVKAYGPDGSRVDSGDVDSGGKTVRVPVRASARGTYAVSYRVVSADGHPVRGATTFHVGQRSDSTRSEDAARDASKSNRAVEVAFGAVRGIALLALLGLAGGVAFVTCLAPGSRPRLLGWMLLVGMAMVAASFVLDAMNATGLGVVDSLRGEVLRAEARTTWGRSALVQLVLLALLAIWLRVVDLRGVRSLGRGLVVAVPFFLPLAAWSAGGHAVADEPVWLRLPLDVLHMSMAALWIGGLLQLLGYLRRDAVTIEHVERYSTAMLVTVGLLVATGLYASWSEIGLSRYALADTTYGRLVIAKSLLLVGVMPLALLNRRRNVPGLRGGAGIRPNDARRSLRRYALGEVGLLVLVLAATAALIQTPPARTAVDPGIVDVDVRLASGATAQLVIDPARAGSNEIHVYASTKDRRLDDAVTNVLLEGDGPNGIENLKLPLLPSGPGHFTTPARTIPFPGTWTFSVIVERGRFESDAGTAKATIGARR